MPVYPRYLSLYRTGALEKRVECAVSKLRSCSLCPRGCGVDRLHDERGWCRTGRRAVVASVCRHDGEEPPVSGTQGSGTVFFAHCTLKCCYCQNYGISHYGKGDAYSADELADAMLELQENGCHNLNLVTPSHVGPQILEALLTAVERGFTLPLVYNSGGYDGIETLSLFDGIVDLYMPDLKYGVDAHAVQLSDAAGYPDHAERALKEMFRQVGELVLDENAVAVQGMLVRHLVLPGGFSGTERCLDFLGKELSTGIGLSLMSQYRPAFRAASGCDASGAHDCTALARPLTAEEYAKHVEHAEALNCAFTWIQKLESSERWYPDFDDRRDPFQRWR